MSAFTRAEVLEARRRQPVRPAAFIPERKGHVRRLIAADARGLAAPPWPPRKEQAACCMALVDDLGRPPLGFCSPECIRRPGNWALVLAGEHIPRGGIPPRPTQGARP